jgi:uncharacterized protein YlaN (UPF0358 family)
MLSARQEIEVLKTQIVGLSKANDFFITVLTEHKLIEKDEAKQQFVIKTKSGL